MHRELPGLTRRLSIQILLLVVASVLSCGLLFYTLLIRPLFMTIAASEAEVAGRHVVDRISGTVIEIDGLLDTTALWGRNRVLRLDDVSGFNQLTSALIRSQPLISAAYVANDRGEEIMFLPHEHGWKNRITNPQLWGKRNRSIEYADTGEKLSEEWTTDDYDPRKRPWFIEGINASADFERRWIGPYTYFTGGAPGLTAVTRWTDAASGIRYVAGLDIRLHDLSHFASGMSVGTSGRVALLTEDGRVLAKPGEPESPSGSQSEQLTLSRPEALGLKEFAAALQHWRTQSAEHPQDLFVFQTADGAGWFRFRPPAAPEQSEITGHDSAAAARLRRLRV